MVDRACPDCKMHDSHCVQIKRLQSDVAEFKESHVTKDEFDPVRKVVYGVVVVLVMEVLRLVFTWRGGTP